MKLVDSFRGDFLGFTLGGLHSTDFNIVRIINGNRFEKELVAPFKNNTLNIPGAFGSHYIDNEINSSRITLKIAYDDLSEKQIRDMRIWLGNEKEQDLFFDEEPYKVYRVRISNQPKLNFICFDNTDETARIYKGEGQIQFDVFNPFARAQFKELRLYDTDIYPNVHEWSEASGLKYSLLDGGYDNFGTMNYCNLYNPGDIDSPLVIPAIEVLDNTGYQSFNITRDGNTIQRLVLDLSKLPMNELIRVDSKTQLILGLNKITLKNTNNVYNRAILGGDFLTIPMEEKGRKYQLTISPSPNTKIAFKQINGNDIDYDYLYY